MGTPKRSGDSAVLPNAHSALIDPKVNEFNSFDQFKGDMTQIRGQLIGIARPVWSKVVESETRLAWLHQMVRQDLVVRDIEAYAQSISACLRTSEMVCKEEERKVLIGLMRVKLKDERKHLDIMRRTREKVRKWIIEIVGKTRTFETIMKHLRYEMKNRKKELN